MKIFFVAVFDDKNISTNNSQARSFEKNGAVVFRYSFREKLLKFKNKQDVFLNDIEQSLNNFSPDLVVFSKCCEIEKETIKNISLKYKTCYWFMDPETNQDVLEKSSYCNSVAIAWEKNLEIFLKYNKNTKVVIEGFDEEIDSPININIPKEWKEFNISFIGSLHSNRKKVIKDLNRNDLVIVQNAYGSNHALVVCNSKINLNISTNNAASDRVFKILAAGGFLLTDYFQGLEDMFTVNKDLVVYTDVNDLKEKIKYYLKNEKERKEIALSGYRQVQKYNRKNWAKSIIELNNDT